jgi:pSer/pThr/pTyr-binding forkhead associated (FHA) protein
MNPKSSKLVTICAAGLLAAFFLPWVQLFGVGVSGYDLGKLGSYGNYAWIIPILAGAAILVSISGASNRGIGALAGIVPLAAIGYGLLRLSRDGGIDATRGVLELAGHVLSIGAWLTIILSISIIVAAATHVPQDRLARSGSQTMHARLADIRRDQQLGADTLNVAGNCTCGFGNVADAKYCGGCGLALTTGSIIDIGNPALSSAASTSTIDGAHTDAHRSLDPILSLALKVIVERSGERVYNGVFRKSLISIGRDSDNDLVLYDPYISSRHLVVKSEGARAYSVFDQSSNGTFCDGRRVSSMRFDDEILLRVSCYDVSLAPVFDSGADARSAVDLIADTALDEPLPEDGQLTAQYQAGPKGLAALPQAELRFKTPSGDVRSMIFHGQALVGRAPGCDLCFEGPDVSRQHFQILGAANGYSLRRLSSKNPVQVNDHVLAEGASLLLRDGDVICFSDERIVFLCPPSGPRGRA